MEPINQVCAPVSSRSSTHARSGEAGVGQRALLRSCRIVITECAGRRSLARAGGPLSPHLDSPVTPVLATAMLLSTQLQYGDDPVRSAEAAVAMERAGLDVVWVAEAYS